MKNINYMPSFMLPLLAVAGFTYLSELAVEHSPAMADSSGKVVTKEADKKDGAMSAAITKSPEIYTFKKKALDGSEVNFSKYKGDVLLIVNTASKCGFTPQYAGLEDLSKKFSEKGLRVLGFPCNQFMAQEPGDSASISSFCKKNYGVDFQMFDKIEVNGPGADALYVYLKKASPNSTGEDIRWNFTKFLVDRKGNVYKRYDSGVKPEALKEDIEKLL